MSDSRTAVVDSTVTAPAAGLMVPLVLLADEDAASRARRADQLRARGCRVTLARTSFEAIVKASCQLPDLILVSLRRETADETAELLSTCPATAHIPIVRLSAKRALPARVFTLARC